VRMSKHKRKWWHCKPRGNIPPSRRWQRFKYGRGGILCDEFAACGEKIVELAIFNDDPVLENGALVRYVFDKPRRNDEISA